MVTRSQSKAAAAIELQIQEAKLEAGKLVEPQAEDEALKAE